VQGNLKQQGGRGGRSRRCGCAAEAAALTPPAGLSSIAGFVAGRKTMEPMRMLLITAALTLSFGGQAQGGINQSLDSAVKTLPRREIRKPPESPLKTPPDDSGAIVVPPKVDPEAIETPPQNIDPGIAKPPPKSLNKKRKKLQNKAMPRQAN
jgi:hypothetical protein